MGQQKEEIKEENEKKWKKEKNNRDKKLKEGKRVRGVGKKKRRIREE